MNNSLYNQIHTSKKTLVSKKAIFIYIAPFTWIKHSIQYICIAQRQTVTYVISGHFIY